MAPDLKLVGGEPGQGFKVSTGMRREGGLPLQVAEA